MIQHSSPRSRIFDRLSSLADAMRSRILLALEGQELTVTELCAVLQVPQSTASRHLKTLADSGWVASRPDGPRRLYHFTLDALEADARSLWLLTRREFESSPTAAQDAARLEAVLAGRRTRSREFFSESADRWDRVRAEMFGDRFHLTALLGLLDPRLTFADLGCGTGQISEALAPFVQRVLAVDGSEAMLGAARDRLARFDNVELRRGDLEALPLEDASIDAASMVLVLHHLPRPVRAVEEVARVLRPGGHLLVVDMLPHERVEYQREMGHVWMGFSRENLDRMLRGAGLEPSRSIALPAQADAEGPGLFAALAVRADPHRDRPQSIV